MGQCGNVQCAARSYDAAAAAGVPVLVNVYDLQGDATLNSAYMVGDLNPGGYNSDPQSITPVAGGVVFTADSGNGDRELYFSDGSTVTRRARGPRPWATSGAGASSRATRFGAALPPFPRGLPEAPGRFWRLVVARARAS